MAGLRSEAQDFWVSASDSLCMLLDSSGFGGISDVALSVVDAAGA